MPYIRNLAWHLYPTVRVTREYMNQRVLDLEFPIVAFGVRGRVTRGEMVFSYRLNIHWVSRAGVHIFTSY